MLNAERDTLVHRGLGTLWPRRDHHRLDSARNRSQVLVGGIAFDLACIGIHSKHVVSALSQTFVDGVAAVTLRLSRDPGHRYSLVSQELGRYFLDRLHDFSLLSA